MIKKIKGYEGYTVSIKGEVANGHRPVKQFTINNKSKQYHAVNLSVKVGLNTITETVQVHRAVATAWLNEPEPNKNIVNHKDGNTLNNNAFNLEWISRKELYKGNGRKGLKHTEATKRLISKANIGANNPMNKGKYICNYKTYPTASQAAISLALSPKTVIKRCNSINWRQKGWYFMPK